MSDLKNGGGGGDGLSRAKAKGMNSFKNDF